MLPHLAADRRDPFLVIQKQQVAVASHQFKNHCSGWGTSWAGRQVKAHDTLESVLFKLHQSQLAQTVLNLLGQGAAATMAPWRIDLHKPGGFRLPAELKPHHALQGAEAELERVGIRLLCLFESARYQALAQIAQHRLQSREIHHLERAGGHPRVLIRCVECLPTLRPDCRQAMAPSQATARLALLTGPSGVGKGTLVALLQERHPHLWLSVSATTRAPRAGEQDGVHYFFKTRQDFDALVNSGGFLEWAEFASNCYGTPRAPVEERLAAGTPVLLEIELEGARQVRKTFPEALQIFLAPPSFGELERRIRGRGTESAEAIQRRLDRARAELDAQSEFDAVVVNDDLEAAFSELEVLMGLSS